MKKLIIERQDDGYGVACYNGKVRSYSYDGEGDIGAAVSTLIDMGFIDPDSVEFFDIYDKPLIQTYEQLINQDN